MGKGLDDSIDVLGLRLGAGRSEVAGLEELLGVALRDTPQRDDIAILLLRRHATGAGTDERIVRSEDLSTGQNDATLEHGSILR